MKCLMLIISGLLLLNMNSVYADQPVTARIPLLSNSQVSVWQTVIYPDQNQVLKMHRHEHNRVVVALNSGTLKITNDKGQIHFLKLEKDKAYYLTKDVPGELHKDENQSNHPIKVIVIELLS